MVRLLAFVWIFSLLLKDLNFLFLSEFKFVAELMRDYSGYTWYWTGATDRDTEGGATDRDIERTFVYQHSRQPIQEKYWKYGQPDDEDQHCALMHSWSNGDLKFYDGRCEWNWFFVCEKPWTFLVHLWRKQFCLTHLRRMDFPIIIICMGPFSYLGALGVIFHLYFIFRWKSK